MLPAVSDTEAYRALHNHNDLWDGALRTLAHRHRLDSAFAWLIGADEIDVLLDSLPELEANIIRHASAGM